MVIVLIMLLVAIVTFLIGIGIGGAHQRKEIYRNIKGLEYSGITDGRFRDLVVNTYVTEQETKK